MRLFQDQDTLDKVEAAGSMAESALNIATATLELLLDIATEQKWLSDDVLTQYRQVKEAELYHAKFVLERFRGETT